MHGLTLAVELLGDALTKYEFAQSRVDDLTEQNKRLTDHHTYLVDQLKQQHDEVVKKLLDENASLHVRLQSAIDDTRAQIAVNRLAHEAPYRRLAKLLNEWLDTPYFKTRTAWKKWADGFRHRVELALSGDAR